MRVLQEVSYGQNIEPSIHHNEEKYPGGECPGQVGVVPHDVIEQCHHLLHQGGVKGQQQLYDVRQRAGVGEHAFGSGEGADHSIVHVSVCLEIYSGTSK